MPSRLQAKPLLQQNEVKELVDPGLGDNYDPSEMKCAMITASMCINHSASKRPTMIRVRSEFENISFCSLWFPFGTWQKPLNSLQFSGCGVAEEQRESGRG